MFFAFKLALKNLTLFLFTMTTNKETFTTTLISLKLPIVIATVLIFRFPPIVIATVLIFRFPPIVIATVLIFRFPPIITTMIFLRTPAIIIPGHSFIPPFN
ncbi:Hypothetical protein bcf_12435 [Bacillus cereus F837/76]|nr:Hypothetical protein bcf_12435 [Bacillus cereus F837/76]